MQLEDGDDIVTIWVWTRNRIKRLIKQEQVRYQRDSRRNAAKAVRQTITREQLAKRRAELQRLSVTELLAKSRVAPELNQQFDDGGDDNDGNDDSGENEEFQIEARPLDAAINDKEDSEARSEADRLAAVAAETKRREDFIRYANLGCL